MKRKDLIKKLKVGLLSVLVIGLAVENWQLKQTGVVYVPSVQELQSIVGTEPDGIVGPETLRKWDEYYCRQSASVWINKETMKGR